jgi:hypothetical protein
MVGGTILHFRIIKKLGEACLLPILSRFGRQGGLVLRSPAKQFKGIL